MTCVIPSQCHSFSLFLMPVVQMHCSSVEAYLLWKCCYYRCVSCSHEPWISWDILLVMSTVAGNLCNKCPKQLVKQKSSSSDYFNAISGLYWTAEPQDTLKKHQKFRHLRFFKSFWHRVWMWTMRNLFFKPFLLVQ